MKWMTPIIKIKTVSDKAHVQKALLPKSIKHLKKTNSSQILPKNRKGENTSKLMLWAQCYSDTKIRQIWQEYWTNNLLTIDAENCQQNTSRSNLATYEMDYIPRPRGTFLRNARLVQHPKINATYQSNKKQKSQNHLTHKKHLTKSNILSQ